MSLPTKAREVIDSMTRDRSNLRQAVLGLSERQTAFRPENGGWSIDDILHHLALTDEAAGKLMAHFQKVAEKENLPEDPEPNASALNSIDAITAKADEAKAVAPDRVTPRSTVKSAEALSRMWTSRERLLESVETLAPLDARRLRFAHPFFGELDMLQWLLVTGWHERRHTLQIERVKTSEGFPSS